VDVRTAHSAPDEILFVDVREAYEWKGGHIRGSKHIPLGELPSKVSELEGADRIVTVCKVGARSEEAARFLQAFGIAAENLDGGVLAWTQQGFELVTPDGSTGRVVM
jgi:rhodanese-related sulfurtransferase